MIAKVNSNMLSGIIFLLISLTIWFLIPSQIEVVERTTIVNAQTFPKIISGVMFFLSIILIIQGTFFTNKAKSIYRKQKNQSFKKIMKNEVNALTMFLIFLGYVLIIEKVGFIIASIILCTLCLAVYKVKKWSYYAVTFSIVFVIYFLFDQLLKLTLP